MTEGQPLVVDTSVSSRWFLQDEKYVPEALAVREDFLQGRIELVAPRFTRHEITSSLSKALRCTDRSQRPTFLEGWAAVEEFLKWGPTLAPTDPLIPAAYAIADRFGCAYYDALYIALAERLEVPFVHADDKLRRTLRGRSRFELWLEDYPAYRVR